MTAPAPISVHRQCAASGRPLLPGEPIVAALYLNDDGDEPRRGDFALQAWSDGARPPGPVIGRWRTRVPEPDARPRMLLDDAGLLDLFDQLDARSDHSSALTPRDGASESSDQARAREAFRFILALMLIRKRILTCEASHADRVVVRVRQTAVDLARGLPAAPLIEVIDPGMDERTLADVTARLTSVLSG